MELTSEQQTAITHVKGHLVVLAGPGSGKTHTITEKIIYLFDHTNEVPEPSGVLAITFTNTAASEMKNRLRAKGFREWGRVHISTFHSFATYLLTCYGSDIGIREDFVVMDSDDQRALLERTLNDCERVHNRTKPNLYELRKKISFYKRNDLYPGENDARIESAILSHYEYYQNILKDHNSLDFDDLIVFAVRLMNQSALARRLFTTYYRYVIVDEFQDTDPLQLELVCIFAESAVGSTVVADDDQSIFAFRGANRHNIDLLESRLDAERMVLNANFRSDRIIIEAANTLIDHERNRSPKEIVATSNRRGRLYRQGLPTPQDEAKQVVSWICQLQEQIDDWGQIAIITRDRWRADVVLRELDCQRVPWFDRGRLPYGESWSTELSLASLGLACDPKSSDGLFQLLCVIENTGLSAALDHEDALDTACMIRDRLAKSAATVWEPRCARDILEIAELPMFIQTVCRNSNEVRFEQYNIDKFIDFIVSEANRRNVGLLEIIRILRGFGAVQVTSGHGSKGTEFDHVFMVGLEDNLIPSRRTHNDMQQLDEERRIFYVGMTRARRAIHFTYASRRQSKNGNWRSCQPSRFLESIPRELFSELT